MKITLTRPNYRTHLVTPPLGLGYLCAYLKQGGHEVFVVDGLNLGLDNEGIVKRCVGSDMVGISCISDLFPEVIELSKLLKKAGFRVVIGGPHATILPDLTLRETGADHIVVGEGEQSLLQLVEDVQGGRTQKKVYESEFINDLDCIPFPDWGQIDPRTYKKAPHGAFIKNFPVAPIVTTRGCPYECKFCASPKLWKRKIRFRSPKNVVDEIEHLVNLFGVREIHFEDDNLTLRREHVEGICNLMLERGIKVSWACPNGVRADKLDPQLLRLMKKAGCYYLAFGVESGNQEILDNINKHIRLNTIRDAVVMAENEGIMTQGFFIFGLPGETMQTIEGTIRFAKSMPLSRAQFLLLDVLPGSALWDELGFAKMVDWNVDSYHEATWVPKGVDRKSLNEAPSRAFKAFFLRPKQFLSLALYFKWQQLPFLLRRMVDFRILKRIR